MIILSKVFIGISAMIFLVGCATSHVVKPDTELHIYRSATLVLTDNSKTQVNSVVTDEDSVVVYYKSTRFQRKYAICDIEKITTRHRGQGALQGALFGAGGGVLAGYINGEDNASDALASRQEGAFVLGIFGGMIGATIGAVKGKTETYLFEETPEETKNSKRPLDTDAEPVVSSINKSGFTIP